MFDEEKIMQVAKILANGRADDVDMQFGFCPQDFELENGKCIDGKCLECWTKALEVEGNE